MNKQFIRNGSGGSSTKNHSSVKGKEILMIALGLLCAVVPMTHCKEAGHHSVQQRLALFLSEDLAQPQTDTLPTSDHAWPAKMEHLLGAAQATLETFNVDPNAIMICEHANFGGHCQKHWVSESDGTRVWDFQGANFNDVASSVQVGPNVKVKFCWNEDCRPEDHNWEAIGPITWPDLSDKNDVLTKMEFSYYNRQTQPLVMMSDQPHFGLGTTTLWGIGKHNLQDMQHYGLQQDTLSSMYIPRGFSVRICEHDFLIGECKEYAGPNVMHNLESGWQGRVSSFEVKDLTITGFNGYWEFHTLQVTGAQYQSTYTLTKQNKQDQSFTQNYQLEISTSASATFLGVGGSSSVTSSMGWSSTFAQAMTYTVSESFTFTCPARAGQFQIGLYIWKMDGYRNNELANGGRTTVYVCRYDQLAHTPPNCAYNLCSSDQCQTCANDGEQFIEVYTE